MAESISDTEKLLLHIIQCEARIEHLETTIASLKSAGHPTETFEALLEAMRTSLAVRKERLSRLSVPITYRCYLISHKHIKGVRVVECGNDGEVLLRAGELLEAYPELEMVEVWQGQRLVASLPRKG